MSTTTPYPAELAFDAEPRITRWRPLVQWVLAVPHLIIARALSALRGVLTLVSLFTVLFSEQIPQAIFDMIAMTYRYEWRTFSYAMFLHDDYPPFDFNPAAADDGLEGHTNLSFAYPEHLNRWKPLYKWALAIPHYVALVALIIAGGFAFIGGFFAVLITAQYPKTIRDFLVGIQRYSLRVEAYVGLLTDEYPPFRMTA